MPPPPTISRNFCSMFSFMQVLNALHLCKKRGSQDLRSETCSIPADAARSLEGEEFGPYKLESEIDRGTFGSVYYCKHSHTNQSYAVKFYTLDWIRTEGTMETIHNELHVMKLLNHRNTVSFQDVIFMKDGMLIFMELVRGKTLLDILPTGEGIMESFARQIFVQVLDGLEYLHQNRIVHRDIKLENIMIDFEGTVKIIDYGLAQHIPRKGCTTNDLLVAGEWGSRIYYAPEIISSFDRPFRGDLTDIWASGVLLYSIITGRFPFNSPEDESSESEILNCESSINHRLRNRTTFSPELTDLFRKIFVKDLEKRPTITELKHHPWVKGTKLADEKDKLNTFTASSANLTVSFVDRKVGRALSCNLNPSSMQSIPRGTAYGIQRCSSSPHIFVHEANDGVVEIETTEFTVTSEGIQSRRERFWNALRNLCEIPKRMFTKRRSRRNIRNQGQSQGNQQSVNDQRVDNQTAEECRAILSDSGEGWSNNVNRNGQGRKAKRGASWVKTRYLRPACRDGL